MGLSIDFGVFYEVLGLWNIHWLIGVGPGNHPPYAHKDR